MQSIWTILFTVLFIALIVGLIKPSIILRWTKSPTRWKVVGYWVLANILIAFINVITQTDEDRIESAEKYIAEKKYADAISTLNDIDESKPLYARAKKLSEKADSMRKAEEAEAIRMKAIEKEKAAEKKRVNQKEQLERELKSIKEGINFSEYSGTVEALQIEVGLFGSWANLIIEGEKSEDTEIKELAKQLRNKVVNIQIKEFPRIRKEYAKVAAKKLWENDIEVSTNGADNKYINFTGALFAANKNKKEFQDRLSKLLHEFRFNQARY